MTRKQLKHEAQCTQPAKDAASTERQLQTQSGWKEHPGSLKKREQLLRATLGLPKHFKRQTCCKQNTEMQKPADKFFLLIFLGANTQAFHFCSPTWDTKLQRGKNCFEGITKYFYVLGLGFWCFGFFFREKLLSEISTSIRHMGLV